jgi:bifunctional DNA-binding transcriptional regulator/antitoxin component of YhaV-PrlF toxin-antitoxin module
MKTAVLKLQSKGQIMLPKEWRTSQVWQAVKEKEVIILKPVRMATDEEFMSAARKVMDENDELLRRLAA